MKDPRPNMFMVTALILALAALLAGPAQAKVIDTDGTTGSQAQSSHQPYDGGIRAVLNGAAVSPLRGVDAVDRGYTGLEPADARPATSSSGDGFDWRDGGTTAALGALLLALLASTAIVTTRHRGKVALP